LHFLIWLAAYVWSSCCSDAAVAVDEEGRGPSQQQ
jgi:hypothetical protein